VDPNILASLECECKDATGIGMGKPLFPDDLLPVQAHEECGKGDGDVDLHLPSVQARRERGTEGEKDLFCLVDSIRVVHVGEEHKVGG